MPKAVNHPHVEKTKMLCALPESHMESPSVAPAVSLCSPAIRGAFAGCTPGAALPTKDTTWTRGAAPAILELEGRRNGVTGALAKPAPQRVTAGLPT
jgi:hypothetical protein